MTLKASPLNNFKNCTRWMTLKASTLGNFKIGNDIGAVHENSFVLFRATNEHEPKVAQVNFH